MPRIARIQRGNYKQTVFNKDIDYKFYIECLNEYCEKYKLSVLAYCLMPNHVHFIVIPENEDSLSKTFNSCHMRYAHYFNKKNNLTGHLWQGRFYSCVLDDKHLYSAVRYIENNPLRAKLVEKAYNWNWSSAKEHINNEKSSLSLVDIAKFMEIDDWKAYLFQKEEEEVIKKIRANTLTGRPSGNDTFIEELEKTFGKRLKALPHGRPRRK